MKFWNKSKDVRLRCWYKISLSQDQPQRGNAFRPYEGWSNYRDFDYVKRRLQLYQSKGKFFMEINNKNIWFERKEDVIWFSLTWGNNDRTRP